VALRVWVSRGGSVVDFSISWKVFSLSSCSKKIIFILNTPDSE